MLKIFIKFLLKNSFLTFLFFLNDIKLIMYSCLLSLTDCTSLTFFVADAMLTDR